MKAVSYILAASVVATAIFALAPHRGTATPVHANVASDAARPLAAATVDTKDYAYAPDPVTIRVGDTVLFENSDSVAHTVEAADGSFDSGNMAQGDVWSHTFSKAGTYPYSCAYHRYMRGEIIVK